jgi:hypothetical protein
LQINGNPKPDPQDWPMARCPDRITMPGVSTRREPFVMRVAVLLASPGVSPRHQAGQRTHVWKRMKE